MSRFLLAAAAIAAALAELKQQQQLLSGIRGKRLQVCIDLSSTLTPHPSAEARHSTTPHVPAKKIQISLVFPDPWYSQIPGTPRSLVCKRSLGSILGWVKIRWKRLCALTSAQLWPHTQVLKRATLLSHVSAKKIQQSLVCPDPLYAQFPGLGWVKI